MSLSLESCHTAFRCRELNSRFTPLALATVVETVYATVLLSDSCAAQSGSPGQPRPHFLAFEAERRLGAAGPASCWSGPFRTTCSMLSSCSPLRSRMKPVCRRHR